MAPKATSLWEDPQKTKKLTGNFLKRVRNIGVFALSVSTHSSFTIKKEIAFIPQEWLRSSHHLLPRAGVLNKTRKTTGQASKAKPWPRLARKKPQGSASRCHPSSGPAQVGTWLPTAPLCTRTAASRGGKRKRRNNY